MHRSRSLTLAVAVLVPAACLTTLAVGARTGHARTPRPAPRTVMCVNAATGHIRTPLSAKCNRRTETLLRVTGVATTAGTTSPSNPRQSITICVSPNDDMVMRMPANRTCRSYEKKIIVSVIGPRGLQGPAGPAGKDGANGADGA